MSPRKANAGAILALACWSFAPYFGSQLKSLPPFQSLSLILALAFLVAFYRVSKNQVWHAVDYPLRTWVFGSGLIFWNQTAYLMAFRSLPPENAELVYYTWPICMALLSGLLPGERFCSWTLIGSVVGFIGLSHLLQSDTELPFGEVWQGYGWILLAMGSWVLFNLGSRHQKQVLPETIGFFSGIGSLVAALIHLCTEVPMAPSSGEWIALAVMGLGTSGIAFILWDRGIKFGNLRVLSVLAYLVPLSSLTLLVFLGKTKPHPRLFQSAFLISIACVLCGMGRLLKKGRPRKALSSPQRTG